jgi:putative transcriptional regulator
VPQVKNLVKEYRTRRELTQRDLAARAGVSRQSIISIERGRYVPSLPLALRLARLLGCPTDELFRLEEDHT